MRQIPLLVACSLALMGSSCGVNRPDTDLCVTNALAEHRKCYNLSRDYDDDGNLKTGAKPTFKPAKTVADLDKTISTDPDGWINLKVYIRELRRECGRKGD